MNATLQNSIRTYHPTTPGLIASVALIPVLIVITWPAAALFGDARTLLVEFVGVPLFSFFVLGITLLGNSFQFGADEYSVLIQRRVLLIPVGEPIRIPFQTITSLDWQDHGEGSDLSMTVAGKKRYYVTKSRSKSRQIAKMVLQAQPNLKPNLHRDLIEQSSL